MTLDFRASRFLALAVPLAAVALIGAGCGSNASTSSNTSSSDTAKTTAASGHTAGKVDVGGGMTVTVPADGKLRIGVFMPAMINANLKQTWEAAKAEAEKQGSKAILYDAAFNPTTQLNQIQNAIQQGSIDAAIGYPVDSNVVCKAFTQDAPKANILVSVPILPMCTAAVDQTAKSTPQDLWVPGTLNFVGSNNYIGYVHKWIEEAAKRNPNAKRIVVLAGQPTIAQTIVFKRAVADYSKDNPNFKIADYLYTNYTAPDAFAKLQTYLQAHSDTDLIFSFYSPDITTGAVQALKAAGKLGKIPIIDGGAATYSLDQIQAGNVQFSMPSQPMTTAQRSIDSLIKAAKEGGIQPHFVDDMLFGTTEDPKVVDKASLAEWRKLSGR
jgi:ABC-type sugar transport system substrate-binding protein